MNLTRKNFVGFEEALDLGLSCLDGIGRVTDVTHFCIPILEAKVTTDGSCRCSNRIGRSKKVTHGGDDVFTC